MKLVKIKILTITYRLSNYFCLKYSNVNFLVGGLINQTGTYYDTLKTRIHVHFPSKPKVSIAN